MKTIKGHKIDLCWSDEIQYHDPIDQQYNDPTRIGSNVFFDKKTVVVNTTLWRFLCKQ